MFEPEDTKVFLFILFLRSYRSTDLISLNFSNSLIFKIVKHDLLFITTVIFLCILF